MPDCSGSNPTRSLNKLSTLPWYQKAPIEPNPAFVSWIRERGRGVNKKHLQSPTGTLENRSRYRRCLFVILVGICIPMCHSFFEQAFFWAQLKQCPGSVKTFFSWFHIWKILHTSERCPKDFFLQDPQFFQSLTIFVLGHSFWLSSFLGLVVAHLLLQLQSGWIRIAWGQRWVHDGVNGVAFGDLWHHYLHWGPQQTPRNLR